MKHTIRIKPGHYVQLDSYRREAEVPSFIYWGFGLCTTIMLVTATFYGIEKYSQQEHSNVCPTATSAFLGPGC
jgi:hypothetical protein